MMIRMYLIQRVVLRNKIINQMNKKRNKKMNRWKRSRMKNKKKRMSQLIIRSRVKVEGRMYKLGKRK
jgi:hypothetical protein